MRGELQQTPKTGLQANGVNIEEKELVEEPVALGASSGTVQPGLLLSSPSRSRLLVSIPMGDSKRKLNNTSEQPHNSPQKHRRLLQGKEQYQPPEPQSPSQSHEQHAEAYDKPDQTQDVLSEEGKADSTAATVPSHSQPDQDELLQKSQDVSHEASISQQKESYDNTPSKETTEAPQTPKQDGDAIKDPSLDEREGGERGVDSQTTNTPEAAVIVKDNWDTQHRRKRARTNDKAEGDGIQDDDEDSDPEEDEENQVVPEYVLREMQAFEQGFNGLQGKFKLLDKIGAGMGHEESWVNET